MIAFSLELDRVADEAAHAVVAVLEKQGVPNPLQYADGLHDVLREYLSDALPVPDDSE
jgi:hypothetical protein